MTGIFDTPTSIFMKNMLQCTKTVCSAKMSVRFPQAEQEGVPVDDAGFSGNARSVCEEQPGDGDDAHGRRSTKDDAVHDGFV